MSSGSGRPKYLTATEYSRLLTAAAERSLRHAFTVLLLGHTGLTTDEAAHFRPDWFDPENRKVTVPRSQGSFTAKSEWRAREIPLQTPASETLQAYLELLPDDAVNVRRQAIYKRVGLAANACDLQYHASHALRKTFAIRLQAIGVPLAHREKILGHQPTRPIVRSEGPLDLNDYEPLYPEFDYL